MRLAALDADAGAALRVIAYFDGLAENKAGLQAIVRGAAVLAGCPARLDDRSRRVHVRVDPDGHAAPDPSAATDRWMGTPVVPDASATLWLERTGEPGPVEAMILERAAGAARAVLDRTRGRVHAFAEASSLRAAATALRLHHSSFQDRISQAEHLLGWPIRDPHGRLRLQLALALRRLRRHPPG